MAKTILLFAISLMFSVSVFSQNIGINVSGNSANSRAILDIDANGSGLLIPRMTSAIRDTIGTTGPAIPEALLIYNTTTQCFEAWNQTTSNWVAFGCIGCQLPGAFSASAATNITTTSFSANWTTSSGATAYFLDVSTSSTFSSFVTGYNNLSVGNVVTYSVNTNLTCNTTYYYRVRANNACGTSANSSTITIVTSACWSCGSAFTDARDSKSYNTVLIGSQCWMAQNLDYGTYVPIATGLGGAGTQKYCYGDNTANCTTYGGLYEWNEMMNGSASCNGTAPPPDANAKCATPVQGICPSGWHIPSHYEWTLLEKNVGSNPGAFPYDITTNGMLGTDEGGNLKQTSGWAAPNTGATNSSGFNALPGGTSWSGSFNYVGSYGFWLSSTETSGTNFRDRELTFNDAKVGRFDNLKTSGFSCRCIKD